MRSTSNLCLKRTISFCLLASFFALSSIQLKAQTCDPNNYAAGKSVTVSSVPEFAANLTDGIINTDWYTPDEGVIWAYVDLTQSYNLCKVVFKWGIWSAVPPVVVQGSNDASTWTDLGSQPAANNGLHAPDNSYDYASIDISSSTTAYRYVRLYFTNVWAWWHIHEIEIYIKQAPSLPEVSLISPANGTTFAPGANITFVADASVQGATISKVEFYQGTNKLGEDLSSPYQFLWANVLAGDYTIVAKAYDANSQSAVSNPIDIHVVSASAAWSVTGNVGTDANAFLGTTDSKPLIFKTSGIERLRITPDGRIGIKTDKFPADDPEVALAIGGNIQARKLKITQATWADFVFNRNYKLPTLKEVEEYIQKNNHLPAVPSAGEIEKKGLDVGDSQALLMQKIEELTLYMIQMNKDIEKLKRENADLKKQLKNKN